MKKILKISFVVALLVLALSLTGYAASVTAVSGTDGTNAFATSADALTADTALETDLTVSGTVDTADANVTIMIEAEDTIVYVNQTVADEEGAFLFDFPVTLEAGYTYEVKVNTENSEDASELYFKTAAAANLHYGDIDGDGAIELEDAVYVARGASGLSLPAGTITTNIDADLGNIDGDDETELEDAVYVARKASGLSLPAGTITERMAWYTAE